jgi:hypothetical protein
MERQGDLPTAPANTKVNLALTISVYIHTGLIAWASLPRPSEGRLVLSLIQILCVTGTC